MIINTYIQKIAFVSLVTITMLQQPRPIAVDDVNKPAAARWWYSSLVLFASGVVGGLRHRTLEPLVGRSNLVC